MTIDRYGIHLGFLFIHFYGIILMCGVIAAAFMSAYRAKGKEEDPEIVWDMLTWLIIAGVIGARIWHILTPPASMVEQGLTTAYYLKHPLDAIAIWRGGLGIPGAVMGGILALFIYSKQKSLDFAKWLDIIAPGLALAQAIGRWGNFINQELYGRPTNLPWAIFIEARYRIEPYLDISHYHPLFLYESIWNIFNMGFLIWINKRFSQWLKRGDLFLCYLVIYPSGRFLLEFLRIDPSPVAGINANQTLMSIIAICSIITLIFRHRKTDNILEQQDNQPEEA